MLARQCLSSLWLSVLAACSSTTYQHNIPNLVEVRPRLWRSGQPISLDSWKYLQNLGAKHVVKLNFESEGSDDAAQILGMTVYVLSIQPKGDADLFDALENTFVHPDPGKLYEAGDILEKHQNEGVLVHCTHGWDRTGLVIGRERVLLEDWTKERAYREMLDRGFHPYLHGLQESWETLRP
jgi:protein tyrosine/serine phosphatase